MPAAARKPLTFDVERAPPSPVAAVATQPRQQVGARVTATVYRQLKARAALQGVAVGVLVEQAIVSSWRADNRARMPRDGPEASTSSAAATAGINRFERRSRIRPPHKHKEILDPWL